MELEDCVDIDMNMPSSFVGLLMGDNVACFYVRVEMQTSSARDIEVDYDEFGTDVDDNEIVTARNIIIEEKRKQKDYDDELIMLQKLSETTGLAKTIFGSDLEDDEDEFDSLDEWSDEDDCGYLVAPEPSSIKKTMKNVAINDRHQDATFFVGQEFENAIQFRKALIDYEIQQGRPTKFTKNHKDRIGVRCIHESCPWYIWVSLDGKKRSFKVKTHLGEHTCGRSHKVNKINALWIVSKYEKKFKINPYLRLQEIMDLVWTDWGIKISKFMAFKARRKAQALVVGEYSKQYVLLPRYAAEIMKSNPKNTVKFNLNENVFQRMYICFDALRNGFLAGCRRFLSLDGCFLKGPYGGQLLVAVGRDGNNQMFPIAWAVVEVESLDSWGWFLRLLADDLGTTHGAGYTIMSDQQKGLLGAISEVFSLAETRYCARHVYCNFRATYGGGVEYRKGFWKIAKSTTKNEFKANMELFKSISVEASNDLLKRNYKKWCRAFFTPQSTCDNVDNNMSEVFNAWILNSRHKPIISLLEDIRENMVERLHKRRDYIGNRDCILCPRIKEKVENAKLYARGWFAYWDGAYSYGVRDGATQVKYVVNLLERTCTCNVWQLSGIPCNHTIAAIWNKLEYPEHYVSEYYTKEMYLRAYAYSLENLNGPQEWPTTEVVAIKPPPLKKIQNRRATKKKETS